MIKLDLIDRIVERTGIERLKAEIVVERIFGAMKEAMIRGERIERRGFGVFINKPRRTGVGRNVRRGEFVRLTGGRTIRFKLGKELRPKISSNGNASSAEGK